MKKNIPYLNVKVLIKNITTDDQFIQLNLLGVLILINNMWIPSKILDRSIELL